MNIEKQQRQNGVSSSPDGSLAQVETKARAVVEAAKDTLRSSFATVLAQPAPEAPADWIAFRDKFKSSIGLVVNKGRALGVHPSILNQYVVEALQEEIAIQSFGIVANILKNLKMGSPEVIAIFEALDARRQLDLAAKKAANAESVSSRDGIDLPVAEYATMADLYEVLRKSSGEVQDQFENDLDDQFDWRFDEFFELERDQKRAAAITVVDFFDEDPDDIETALPLRFASPRGENGQNDE
jgi:hypothetical protein